MKTSIQLFVEWYQENVDKGHRPTMFDILKKSHELKEKEKNDIIEAYINGFTPVYSSTETVTVNSSFRTIAEKYYEEKFI